MQLRRDPLDGCVEQGHGGLSAGRGERGHSGLPLIGVRGFQHGIIGQIALGSAGLGPQGADRLDDTGMLPGIDKVASSLQKAEYGSLTIHR